MNKFGQKIRDCGRPRISSARPGTAMMASFRHWAVPAVMAAALMLSGCQTLNPDSAEGASNSLLKAIAVAFVGGAAIWGSTGGGSSDDSPLLPTLVEEPTGLAGSFSEAEDQGGGRYRINTPLLNAPAGDDGFQIEILISRDFMLLDPLPGDCERQRCVVTIPPGERSLGLFLVPLSGVVVPSSPPMVSLIPSDDYDIQRVLTFREPIKQGDDRTGRASFTVLANAPVSTGDRFVVRFRVEGGVLFDHVPGANPTTCDALLSICEVTIPDGETSAELIIAPTSPNPNMEWRLSLIPDDVDPDLNNDNYDIQPTLGFFLAEQPPSVTQTGRATFTIFSNTPAPAGGLDVRVTITGETFDIGEPSAGQLAAIAAIVGRQANHIPCDGSICTVTIPEGATLATLILIPMGEANDDADAVNRWTVALIPGINFEIERDSNIDNPVEVENTPTGIRGGFIDLLITDTELRQVSIQTPVLDRVAGSNGFNIAFTLPANLRPVSGQTELDCTGTACTVTIPAGSRSLDLLFVTTPTETGFTDASFTFGDQNPMTGEIIVTTPILPDVMAPNRVFMFTVPDGFAPIASQPTGVSCTSNNVCTVTIQDGETSLGVRIVPVPIAPTDPPRDLVAIEVPVENNDFEFLPLPPPPFAVGLGTPELMVDPDTGDVTFTVRSDENAPAGGLAVRFRIEGDAFIAMRPNADGTRTPLTCSFQNVCTITIPAGSDTAAFILVPDGPRSPDSDLFTRWTVAIVDDTRNNYDIDDDNQVAVVATGLLTPIAAGGTTVLDENAAVRFGDLSASFSAFGRDGALPDVLEIPSAPRVLAGSGANPFASGYGYFADDGGFLPVGTDMQVEVPPTLPPPNLGPTDQISGQVDITFPMLDAPAPSGGFEIEFTVSGSNSFTATLLDAVDLADRTSVTCEASNVCTVTIPEGETGFPSSGNRVRLMPTVPLPGNQPNWMVMINTVDPILPDPLSVNRANNDEAVFYARRGDKLVARFHTTGTFTDTANVELLTPLNGRIRDNTLLPEFVREEFNPNPFAFDPSLPDDFVVLEDCSNLGGDPFDACDAERDLHEEEQDRLETAYDNFDYVATPFDPSPFGNNVDETDCSPLSGAPLAACETARTAHETRQAQLLALSTSVGTTYLQFLTAICVGDTSTVADDCADLNDLGINFNVQPRLIVDGRGIDFRTTLQEGNTVTINRPVAIALPITSTLIAAADDAQELVYSYFVDATNNINGNSVPDGMIDLTPANEDPNGRQFDVFNTDTIGSALNFALYQSGDIPDVPDALPPTEDFSISQIDSSRELLGKSNVRTFLYENEFSAIGAWLIPPSGTDDSYYAAAAHWFGFETPAAGIPTGGEAVYGGIAIGDFRQVTFDNAGEFAGKSSYYVRGNAQFDADFGNGEMNGQFDLFAYDPEDVYGDPSLLLSQPLDLLVVNWDGQILSDGGGFANNFVPVSETVVAIDPNTGMPMLDPVTSAPIMRTRNTFAATGTIFQPLRATVEDRDGNPILQAARIPVFDNLVDFDRIPGVDPSLPAPIGSETLFSVFGKFFGPTADEVAGELRVFNSRDVFVPEMMEDGNEIPQMDKTVTNSLEVHFTADGAPVPGGRFDLPDIGEDFE